MARSVQQNWMILGAIVFVTILFVSFRSGSSPESPQSAQAKVKSQTSAAAANKALHPLDDLDNYNDFPTLGPFDASVELDEELEAKYENREADLLVCKDYEEDLMLMDADAKQHLNNEINQMKKIRINGVTCWRSLQKMFFLVLGGSTRRRLEEQKSEIPSNHELVIPLSVGKKKLKNKRPLTTIHTKQ